MAALIISTPVTEAVMIPATAVSERLLLLELDGDVEFDEAGEVVDDGSTASH